MIDLRAELSLWDGWNAGGGPKYPRDEVVRFFLRRYPSPEGRGRVRVLDLGCGGGVHTLFLAEEGFSVVATDLSPVAVATTSRRLAGRGLDADGVVSSFDALPFRKASFDHVLSVGVLECAAPGLAQAAVPAIATLLRPAGSGLFIFATNLDYRINDPKNAFVRQGFLETEVEAMFGDASWTVEINRHTATEQGRTMALDEWMVTVSVP